MVVVWIRVTAFILYSFLDYLPSVVPAFSIVLLAMMIALKALLAVLCYPEILLLKTHASIASHLIVLCVVLVGSMTWVILGRTIIRLFRRL